MRLAGLDPDQRQPRFLVAAATAFEFERHVNLQEAESLEEYADLFMERFPPMVTAKAVLGERFQELRERIVGIWRDANEA